MGNCCVPHKETEQPRATNSVISQLGEKKKSTPSARDTKNFCLSPGDFIKVKSALVSNEYNLVSIIGSGSFGEVWLGIHKETGSKRAIKQIFLSSDSENNLEKLLKEVSILKRLDHPNIIRIYEVYKNKSKLSIVTEYCEGGELFDKIQKLRRFTENQAAKYFSDMVSAVLHCHDLDIVHRDLKPENMLLVSDSETAQLKLIDFGTSRFIPDNRKLKKPIGTCFYMAPEVLTSEYGKKVDVWSLGVILYVMLSGSVPFPGRTDQEIFLRIKNSPLLFDKPCWSTVSDQAKFLIRKMLDKKPENRYDIEQVFNDPWLQQRASGNLPDIEVQMDSLRQLSEFRTEGKLQKSVYIYIVTQFMENKHFEKLREVFVSVDKNGDGFLSNEEIMKACEDYDFHININEILQECDHDKNGLINYSEFLTATVNKSEAFSKANIVTAFKRFDRNGDGKIDIDELKQALGGKSNDSVFKQMIAEADKNNDGVIDVEEFIEHLGAYTSEVAVE